MTLLNSLRLFRSLLSPAAADRASPSKRRRILPASLRGWVVAAAAMMVLAHPVPGLAQSQPNSPDAMQGVDNEAQGPVRLTQTPPLQQQQQQDGGAPTSKNRASPETALSGDSAASASDGMRLQEGENGQNQRLQGNPYLSRNRYQPSEFERFVQNRSQDPDLKRFGADLLTGQGRSTFAPNASGIVPPDYVIGPDDEIVLTLWGSVEANLRMRVDRTGQVSIPRVGSVTVVGVRFADLPDVLRRHVGQVFRNFQLAVTMGQLRGVRVYVTGFAQRPGAYTVSSLSTLLNALMAAGGPSPVGSFRDIQLRRGSTLVTTFDLYDLLLKGDKTADRVVQGDDVIFVGPIGAQVGMIGSVNKPAVFEVKPGETIGDVLHMAGGFTAVADRTRLAAETLEERQSVRVTELVLPQSLSQPASNGEVLRAFSAVSAALSIERQNKHIRIDGEVLRPGEYILPASSSLADAIAAAGGLSPKAYVFGTEFTRVSALRSQRENYDRALRDMETDFARMTSTQKAFNADEANAHAAQADAASRLIQRLRAVQPTGRIVLQLSPDSTALPPLTLEDGDRLHVPARPSSIGVFGSVFNAGNYVFDEGHTVGDYLNLAGGGRRSADERSTFVVRANGSVVSNLQSTGWFGMGGKLANLKAEPGDTIFVPDEIDRTSFFQEAREWTQILYQFGLGAAALKTLRQ